jgi:hypothetical protein
MYPFSCHGRWRPDGLVAAGSNVDDGSPDPRRCRRRRLDERAPGFSAASRRHDPVREIALHPVRLWRSHVVDGVPQLERDHDPVGRVTLERVRAPDHNVIVYQVAGRGCVLKMK